MVAGDAGVALKDFGAEVSAVLLALPSWVQDGNVSGPLICNDQCLWARGSGPSQKRTEFRRKLGGIFYDSKKGGRGGNNVSSVELIQGIK